MEIVLIGDSHFRLKLNESFCIFCCLLAQKLTNTKPKTNGLGQKNESKPGKVNDRDVSTEKQLNAPIFSRNTSQASNSSTDVSISNTLPEPKHTPPAKKSEKELCNVSNQEPHSPSTSASSLSSISTPTTVVAARKLKNSQSSTKKKLELPEKAQKIPKQRRNSVASRTAGE